jgi:hypothetical protein
MSRVGDTRGVAKPRSRGIVRKDEKRRERRRRKKRKMGKIRLIGHIAQLRSTRKLNRRRGKRKRGYRKRQKLVE